VRLLMRSCGIARRQSALSWELRSTLTLASICAGQGRGEFAHHLLASVYTQFSEGFDTQDLKAAKSLLGELSDSGPADTSVDAETPVSDFGHTSARGRALPSSGPGGPASK
jgi:transcriptional regulator